jgi:hypothetical protein
MNEYLFQYLWLHSLYQPFSLSTTQGEPVTVLFPGRLNSNAGPDFLDARIKIGNTVWAGNVELHMRASDWEKHGHAGDHAYSNIILHVVYEDDLAALPGSFPTLELMRHIDKAVIDRYQGLVASPVAIPCAGQLNQVPEIIWTSWLERLLAERWEDRLEEWKSLWLRSGKDWRTLLYYRLAANFGFHTNRDAFLELSLATPLNVLVRCRHNLQQTEALLFGQAGLLQGKQDSYMEALEKEYHFIRRKYMLSPMEAHHWKFMRLRPQNFPTVRIAQFAMLVHRSLELFSRMMEIRSGAELVAILDIQASSYWDTHYRFGEETGDNQVKQLGKDAIFNIMINTVAPMQYLYARLQGKTSLHENSLFLLQSLKAENNKVIREWERCGVIPQDAASSQSLLQLFNRYCSRKKCLNCAVGNRLLRY